MRLSALAARYGTPAFILHEADARYRCRSYAAALRGAEVAYTGKAFLCRAMARWIAEEGLSLDVCSAGEVAVAHAAGFPAGRIILHGNAKTPAELQPSRTAPDDRGQRRHSPPPGPPGDDQRPAGPGYRPQGGS